MKNNDINTSMEENPSLKEEIQEVKQLISYRNEREKRNSKPGHGIATAFLVAGILDTIVCVGYFLLAVNMIFPSLDEDGKLLTYIFMGIGALIGILMTTFSSIAIHNFNKKQNKSKLLVMPSEDFLYEKGMNQNDYEVVYVNEPVELNSMKKVEERKFVSPLADLEDEEEAAGSSVVHVVRNYDFFEFTSANIVDRFVSICKSNGLEISKKDAATVMSHVGYSRFMIINNMSPLYRHNLTISLARCFCAKAFLIDAKGITTEQQLVSNDSFNEAFESADKNPDEFVFLSLNNIDGSKLDELLADFKDCIFDKNNKHKIKTPYSDKRYEMVPNLFFLAFVEDGLSCPKEFLSYSPLIELKPSLYVGEKEFVENKQILVSDFRHVLDLIKRENSLEENIWRKLDGFEKFVSSIKLYKIENDIVNDIENHVAYLMSVNMDADSIVDEILAIDLLPGILAMLPKERIFGEDSLEMYISDNFESDYSLMKVDALLRDYSSLNSKGRFNSVKETKPEDDILQTKLDEEKKENQEPAKGTNSQTIEENDMEPSQQKVGEEEEHA